MLLDAIVNATSIELQMGVYVHGAIFHAAGKKLLQEACIKSHPSKRDCATHTEALMFGKNKELRKDLPAIDISKKPVRGMFGQEKYVPTTKREQRQIKQALMEQYPDRYFVDDLKEWNSISPEEIELRWIDEIEAFDALFGD